MTEGTSLTDAIKLSAGISLTKAVKDAAGRRDHFIDEVLDRQDYAGRTVLARWAPRAIALCPRLAAFAIITLTFLHVPLTSPVSMLGVGHLLRRTGAPRS